MASWRHFREAGADVVERIRLRLDPEGLGYGALCDHDSRVHTAAGDVLAPESRSSRSAVGDDETIFELLQEALPRGFEIVRGHYDLVHYREGGRFKRHADFCPARAQGLTRWHGLLCLEAPLRGGGTRVFLAAAGGSDGDAPGATTVRWAEGDVLLIAGAEHEGLPVEAGSKTLLKFDALGICPLHFEHGQKLARCRCADGSLRLPERALRRSLFFDRLLSFEGQRAEHSVAGLQLDDMAAVYAYLSGVTEPEQPERLHGALEMLCCPEGALSPTRFRRLVERGALCAETPPDAAVLAEIAASDLYELFVILRRAEWTRQAGEQGEWRSDLGIFVLSSTGRSLFSTGAPWLGPDASRTSKERRAARFNAEPDFADVEACSGARGEESWDRGQEPDESEGDEGMSAAHAGSGRKLAAPAFEVPAVAAAFSALRAVIRAQEAGRSQRGASSPHPAAAGTPAPAWCEELESLVHSECPDFELEDCATSRFDVRADYETCNDGDGYYVHQYVTTGFMPAWLLRRKRAEETPP